MEAELAALRLCNHNLRRGRRRLRLQHQAVLSRMISPEAARTSLLSWNAHLAHGHTWRLRRRLFASSELITCQGRCFQNAQLGRDHERHSVCC